MNEQSQLSQVLNILMQAAEMGQAKGAYALADAGVISQAVAAAKEMVEAENKPEMEVAKDDPKKKK